MNKIKKQNILILFFYSEIALMVFLYVFGSNGLPVLRKIKKENLEIFHEIGILQHEVAQLEKKCQEWQEYSFYKEKIAREQLQMAREGDLIYYYSNEKEET